MKPLTYLPRLVLVKVRLYFGIDRLHRLNISKILDNTTAILNDSFNDRSLATAVNM